jgi:lipoprotein signal peptidase
MVPDRSRELVRFTVVALVAAGIDLVTKGIASVFIMGPTPLVGLSDVGVHLTTIHNQLSAFGLSLGPLTWEINVIVTLPAIVLAALVCRDLAAIDRAAPYSLGLITGAALGNLTSLLVSPDGVLDFIAVHVGDAEVVMNVADIAAYAGLGMLLHSGFRVYAALQAERSLQRTAALEHLVPRVARETPLELVVARPVLREPLAARDRAADRPAPRDPPTAKYDADEAVTDSR